jgi:hypothetical protein
MRRAVPAIAAATLLAGPTVLAFFSGGYFIQPRLWAGLAMWAVVLLAVAVSPRPLPRSRAGRAALLGLAALAAWSAVSVAWAPLAGPAIESVQRLVLYLGALLAAAAFARTGPLARAAEPALAAGVLIVMGYALAGRLLPGLLHLAHSAKAGGRLEQPITYWNSEGALAAVGLVLVARLRAAGDRPAWLRVAAAAGAVPLGAAVYLSYSRGAIAAAVVGLIVLVAALPTRGQLRAAVQAAAGAVLAALICAALGPVADRTGTLAAQERDGAIVLVALIVLAAVAALVARRTGRASAEERLSFAHRLPAVAVGVVVVAAAGLVVGGLGEKGSASNKAGAARLASVSSNRYEYWRVGARAFAAHPLDGLGAAGFRTYWTRHRSIDEGVLEVHSIELEMAAELGLVGLAAFALFVGGIGVSARRALRRAPPLAAGPIAAATTWLLHATIDWDWQMPAVTLPALILAGLLIAQGDSEPANGPASRRAEPDAVVAA